ncbi:putative E3 ubiquitin-protein ligase dtx2 [Mortierella sp. GBA35]|nr:putative E3 ubiquitin-protein ligase dtx2 [Mortierella sp. GBA35]
MVLESSTQLSAEYSDQFIPLFDTPPTTAPSFVELPQAVFPRLYASICNDFYSHTRCPTDFDVQNIQVLRNSVVWKRYHAEKQFRRRLEHERQQQLKQQDMDMDMDKKVSASGEGELINSKKRKKLSPSSSKIKDTFTAMPPPDTISPEELFRDELLFHGTQRSNLASILSNGLDPRLSHRRNFGAGCYFSDAIEKCMQYVDPQTEIDQVYSILVCVVVLGRVLVEPQDKTVRALCPKSFFLPEGYDSAVGEDCWKEWVVFDKAQVLPLCVINLKATNDPKSYLRLSKGDLTPLALHHPNVSVPVPTLVPAPLDAKAWTYDGIPDGETAVFSDEKEPDVQMAQVFETLLDIPQGTSRVKQFWPGKAIRRLPNSAQHCLAKAKMYWIITEKSLPPGEHVAISDVNYTLLLQMTRILREIEASQRNNRQSIETIRKSQAHLIHGPLRSIPSFDGPLGRWEHFWPHMALEKQAVRACIFESRYPGPACSPGMQSKTMIQSETMMEREAMMQRYHQEIEAIYRNYVVKIVKTGAWTPEQVATSFNVFEERKALEFQTRLDNDRFEQDARDLEEEAERQREVAKKHVIRLATGFFAWLKALDDADEALMEGETFMAKRRQFEQQYQQKHQKRQRGQQKQKQKQPPKVFAMVDTVLDVQKLAYRPQLMADLCLVNNMTMRSAAPDFRTLYLRARSTDARHLLRHVGEERMHIFRITAGALDPSGSTLQWWDICPMALTQAKTPAPHFWPVHPRTRLPNRSFYCLTDYVDWIFKEKSSRMELLSGVKETVSELASQDGWETIDPWIRPAIEGLSSRSGSVFFNRKERQAEIDKLGVDMVESLFLRPSGPNDVQGDEAAAAKATAASSKPGEKWRFATGACPICTDSLVGPESKVDGIVQLHKCCHCFHEECIKTWFLVKGTALKCPVCNTRCGGVGAPSHDTIDSPSSDIKGVVKLGPMSDAKMGYSFDARYGCYFLYFHTPQHTIPDPEDLEHKSITIKEDCRHAIVPFSAQLGPLLMIRLICAFYYGHFFRVGTSVTRGLDNVVIWNGIHMRANVNGPHGFPARDFESNCWSELNQQGVAMKLDLLLLSVPSVTDDILKTKRSRDAELNRTVTSAKEGESNRHYALGQVVSRPQPLFS